MLSVDSVKTYQVEINVNGKKRINPESAFISLQTQIIFSLHSKNISRVHLGEI